MSLPECYLPNTTYLLTHRCSERRFFLKPSPEVDQAFLFCLLHAAAKYGVRLHAFVAMSNHFHMVVTDGDEVQLPDFMCWFNSQVARCLNAHYGRWENFWTPGPYSRQVLGDVEAVLEEIAYTIANPVLADLVKRPEDWPGVISLPGDIGKVWTVDRPDWYFRQNGTVPESAEGSIHVPQGFEGLSSSNFTALVGERVEAKVDAAKRNRESKNRKVLGPLRVLSQKWHDKPRTGTPRRKLNPRVACKDIRLRKALLIALEFFRKEYRKARLRFRDGDRQVLFPFGTYWMRRHAGVLCHPPPPT